MLDTLIEPFAPDIYTRIMDGVFTEPETGVPTTFRTTPRGTNMRFFTAPHSGLYSFTLTNNMATLVYIIDDEAHLENPETNPLNFIELYYAPVLLGDAENSTRVMHNLEQGQRVLIAVRGRALQETTLTVDVFQLQQGITVSVVDGNGMPIEGAIVQFVRRQSISFRTNELGIAMFPNAYARAYGINVMHPNFASVVATSRRIERDVSENWEWRYEPFVMYYPAEQFRRLGWHNVLPNMCMSTDCEMLPNNCRPRYRISSLYGFREDSSIPLSFHNGIDVVCNTGQGAILGRDLFSVYYGEVVFVNDNPRLAMGYSIVIRVRDSDNPENRFYVRYSHLYQLPALSVGNIVIPGQLIGIAGNTPRADPPDALYENRRDRDTAPHLHLDIHRNHNPGAGRRDIVTIDPQAFFEEGFAEQWRGLNIQN